MDLQLQLEQRSLEPAKKAFKEFEAAAGIYSVDFSEVSLELEKPKVNWGKAEEALQTAYRGAFEKPEMYEALEQGSCIRAAWLAVEANDPGFLAKSKISEHCQRLVGPNWTADEKLLRQMLKEQTTDVEPETRRGM